MFQSEGIRLLLDEKTFPAFQDFLFMKRLYFQVIRELHTQYVFEHLSWGLNWLHWRFCHETSTTQKR